MERDELLRMLDLSGKEADGKGTDLPIQSTATPDQPTSTHTTALDLDDWGLRRGRETLDESERLQGLDLDEHSVADFFGSAFEPEPRLRDSCIDPQRHEFLKQLLETPEYRSLHTSTMLHTAASAIAAAAFGEQFAQLKEDQRKKNELDREMDTLRAAGKALAKAVEEVGEMHEAASALGLGSGSPGSNDPKAIAELYRRVRNSPTLKRICELAGRYRRLAQSRQRQKQIHGVDDVVGVTLDGDLGRVLPHELARLAIPELEDDTLRRLAERQLMSREYHGTEPVAKGPIIVCVDESGSMQGEKANTAKALALAMAWVARQQRRWIALVAYSGDSGERLLALPPGRWNEQALMTWLEEFIGRGSSIDVPVREMPRMYRQLNAPAGVTDVIFITDAMVKIPGDVEASFLAWKQAAKARLISLIIHGAPGDLEHISDETHQVESLSVEEAAVGRVLSI